MPKVYVSVTCLLILVAILGCRDEGYEKKKDTKETMVSTRITALPKTIISPKDNPPSPEKEELGKLLFFDPILSGNKDVACATCHHPSTGYAEFLDLSIGPNAEGLGSRRKFKTDHDIPLVKRNAQTVINTAFNGINASHKYDPENATMFWDDRAKSLEKQALEPIKAFEEMRGHGYTEEEILDEVVDRLKAIPEYEKLFEAAFGEVSITIENMAKAIAAFERTLVTNNSRFDKYMRGDDEAILISEKEGFELFKKVGCVNCHNGPMFSDYKMHVLGAPENNKLGYIDAGFKDTFAFRTPTLRNLRFTAPYMHNGSLPNLQRVLEFYEDISNGKVRNTNVPKEKFDPFVRELELSVKEMSLIISFLNTLNDDSFSKEIPEAVPSDLSVGGNIE
ncbi:cytochrome-c peroxidase [Maribacter halichondriae]|uniref:cytochrome-c peroxidase n=1 Tax=Maribacter halichondriae TaxID=2980554 RepID=UPI00235A3BC7|nr:cytochrome c peroxidase [Maribacter sp. Hal144]